MYRPVLMAVILIASLLYTLITLRNVDGVADIDPPVIVWVSVEPQVVNIGDNAQTITLTARITDDLSGCPDENWCAALLVRPVNPELSQFQSATLGNQQRITGSTTDGIYQARLTIPQYAATGIWQLSQAQMNDNAGNYCFVTLPTSSLVSDCLFDLPIMSFSVTEVEFDQKLYLPLISDL